MTVTRTPDRSSALPMELPKCEAHGQMMLRPLSRQTPDQEWCGVWYDCGQCGYTVLFPSEAVASLHGMERTL